MPNRKTVRSRLAVVTSGAALFAACSGPPPQRIVEAEPTFDPAAEAEVIKALERQWMQRLLADDVDWIVDLHTADAWQLPPDAEPVVGHEALRAAWQAMASSEGLEITWEPSVVRVSASGDMAYDLGYAVVSTPDGLRQPAKYLVVWLRQGGRWKVAADMFSPNGPAAPPEDPGITGGDGAGDAEGS